MVIRKGSSDDMFSIRDILLKMHSETTLSVPSIDMEKLTYHILHALKNGHVFVAVLKNKVIGTIGGLVGSDYSGDIDRKDKFYERLGFTKAGSLFTEA